MDLKLLVKRIIPDSDENPNKVIQIYGPHSLLTTLVASVSRSTPAQRLGPNHSQHTCSVESSNNGTVLSL
jgi:hypothetical protein